MTLLDRYYLRRMTAVFLRTALALLGLFIIIDLLAERRGQIMDHDIPWQVVVQYYGALAPNLIYQMAPLAVLISALLVLGESAQHNEVTAALAGGISLRRFVRIPVAVALAVALLMFAMDESVGATSYRKAAHLKQQFFRLQSDAKHAISLQKQILFEKQETNSGFPFGKLIVRHAQGPLWGYNCVGFWLETT